MRATSVLVCAGFLIVAGCALRDNPFDPSSPCFRESTAPAVVRIDSLSVSPTSAVVGDSVTFTVTTYRSDGQKTIFTLVREFDQPGTYLFIANTTDSNEVVVARPVPVTVYDSTAATG